MYNNRNFRFRKLDTRRMQTNNGEQPITTTKKIYNLCFFSLKMPTAPTDQTLSYRNKRFNCVVYYYYYYYYYSVDVLIINGTDSDCNRTAIIYMTTGILNVCGYCGLRSKSIRISINRVKKTRGTENQT